MSNIFPAALRLFDTCELTLNVLAYELLSALVALDERGESAGDGIEIVRRCLRVHVPVLKRDRAPGPDAETIVAWIADGALDAIMSEFGR